MSLFVCDECGTVENTALSLYWKRKRSDGAARCSACDPEIGKWHDAFPRRQWDGTQGVIYAPEGHPGLVGKHKCGRCGTWIADDVEVCRCGRAAS